MRTRMYGGVRGRKTKVGGKPTFVFLLLDYKLTDEYLIFKMRKCRILKFFRTLFANKFVYFLYLQSYERKYYKCF